MFELAGLDTPKSATKTAAVGRVDPRSNALSVPRAVGNRALAALLAPRSRQTLARCSGRCTCGGACRDDEQELADSLAAGRVALRRAVLARAAQCPSAEEVGLPTKPPPDAPDECSDPTLRKCYSGPLETISNWIPDGDGGYTKCTYNETVCECYDKDPNHVYEYEGWKDLWGYAPWAPSPPRLVGGYKVYSLSSDPSD